MKIKIYTQVHIETGPHNDTINVVYLNDYEDTRFIVDLNSKAMKILDYNNIFLNKFKKKYYACIQILHNINVAFISCVDIIHNFFHKMRLLIGLCAK